MWRKLTYLFTGALTLIILACSDENPTDFSVYAPIVKESSSSEQDAESSSSSIIEVSSSSSGISSPSEIINSSSSSDIAFSSSIATSSNSISSSSVEIESCSSYSSSSIEKISSSNSNDTFLWRDSYRDTILTRFSGDSSEIVPAGRFYLIKDTPLSPKERDLLKEKGIIEYEVGRLENKIIVLFTTEHDIKKTLIVYLIAGFFNTIDVDDKREKTIDIKPEDLNEDSTVTLQIDCWPDVILDKCTEIVANCNGKDIEVRTESWRQAKILIDSLSCLGKNKDIQDFYIKEEPALSILQYNIPVL